MHTFHLQQWSKLYKNEINDILESFMDCVNGFSSEEHVCFINVPGMREALRKIVYDSSKNRYKGFMLGF